MVLWVRETVSRGRIIMTRADALRLSAAPQLSPAVARMPCISISVPLALLPYEMPQSRMLPLHCLFSLLSLKGSPRLFSSEVSLIITVKKQTGTSK